MGIAARSTVFAYNTTMLTEAELPKSMMDLANPEWQGRWGAAPAGADFQAIVSAVLQLRGEEETATWLAGLKANSTAYRGNGEALRGVNLGEIAGAVIYHYYYFGDKAGTGENTNNVALHFFRNQDPGASSRPRAAASSRPATTRRRRRPSSPSSPGPRGRRWCATAIRTSIPSGWASTAAASCRHSTASTIPRSILRSSMRRPWSG
jgi:iron(III) transport system substrate-binding protein